MPYNKSVNIIFIYYFNNSSKGGTFMEKKDSQFGSKELEFAIFCIENIT